MKKLLSSILIVVAISNVAVASDGLVVLKSAHSVDKSENLKVTPENQEVNAMAQTRKRTSLPLLVNMKDMDHDLQIDIIIMFINL